jgi:hypothetical protein
VRNSCATAAHAQTYYHYRFSNQDIITGPNGYQGYGRNSEINTSTRDNNGSGYGTDYGNGSGYCQYTPNSSMTPINHHPETARVPFNETASKSAPCLGKAGAFAYA